MKIRTLRAFRLGATTFARGAEATVSDASAADLGKRGFAEVLDAPANAKSAKSDPLDHDQNGRKGGSKAGKPAAKRDDEQTE